jgi:hypothetical protein
MPRVTFDANIASRVAAIAASLAALASAISAIISALALRRTTKQTNILAEQFEIAEIERKESARPRLTVEVSDYRPPDSGQNLGAIKFTLRNAGRAGFRVVNIRTQSGNTQNRDMTRSIEVHPGYPAETVVDILPPGGYNPPTLKAWFEIETPDDIRHRHAAEWELQRSHFVLLKSEALGG